MPTIRVSVSVTYGTTTISSVVNETVEGVTVLQEAVPDTSTDKQFVTGIDVSSAKIICLECDQDVTVKTNSSGSPQETISLIAGRPIIWQTGDSSALFAGDVTSFFVTNASGTDATFSVIVGTDTP